MPGRGTAALAGLLLALSPSAFALNPSLDVSQYAHFAWRFRDGFGKGYINSMAQTPDGYLWLTTDFGLLRFDGIKAVPWQPPSGQPLPSEFVVRVLRARDGTLWIGTRNGLASWKDGKLTQYPELAGLVVGPMIQDHEGVIWAGARPAVGSGKLCEIRESGIRCSERSEVGRGVFGLYEDRKGNLWVGTLEGVWRWKPGPPQFYPVPNQSDGIQDMVEDEDGSVLICVPGAIKRLVDGKAQAAYLLPAGMRGFQIHRMLRDRDGGLWVGTRGGGIAHLYRGRTDVFSQSDGLTDGTISALFEDHEGNIWAATNGGLDRFHELPVVNYSANQGIARPAGPVLSTTDGSIWFPTLDGLERFQNGHFTGYRGIAPAKPGAHDIAVPGLPDRQLRSLFQDSHGRVWISSQTGIGYLEDGRYVSTPAPGGMIDALAEDSEANMWIANQNAGLFRLSPDNEVQQIPWAALGRKDTAMASAADVERGGVWLGFYEGGIARFQDGRVRASYSAADGLGAGDVSDLRFDKQGALWASTAGGLSRLKEGRIITLNSRNGLPCDAVHWSAEDDAQSVWLMMACGLVRVARSELDAWAAAPNKLGFALHPTVFDNSDGVSLSTFIGYTPHVAKSADGRLWFYAPDGISVVDPRRLAVNKLPPPVSIEQIKADGKPFALKQGLRLPAGVRDVWIDYAALSLSAPEKTRFRYKLEGQDPNWIEVTNDRKAQYSNLPPRNYRFRVMAANNSGVWNEAGTSLDFSIAPAYYQTTWFFASCVAAFLASLAGLYRLRLLYLTKQFNARLEGRVSERTRVARDLHDTLLQSFQGVLLKFSTIKYIIPDRPTEAVEALEHTIEQARAAITEGRDAVQGMRSSTVLVNDLARAIGAFVENLAADRTGQNCPEFRVYVEGKSRDLPPLVRDEVYKIACESLRNAFQHADARRIEVQIRYDSRQFRLQLVDNGKGIHPAVLSAGGRAGHHGLPGLHERAQIAGGKLSIWSQVDSGTEIELTIPAHLAYTKSPAARGSTP
jgi:signal transduction histidine kinase/ligand-binding sensor domain-containing protein